MILACHAAKSCRTMFVWHATVLHITFSSPQLISDMARRKMYYYASILEATIPTCGNMFKTILAMKLVTM
jgi:hypothetical protein